MHDLLDFFGPIDIYLFDQLLRGRISSAMTVLDAGCGRGRNLVFFLRQGHPVFALDPDPTAVRAVRTLAGQLAPSLPAENFRSEAVESTSFPDHAADVVLSNAVLHFARDEPHFRAMLLGCWRLLRPEGLFFCRLASSIGMEDRFEARGGRRFGLLDGSERFLDPLKTTVVQDQRAMTTWVLRKSR